MAIPAATADPRWPADGSPGRPGRLL